MHACCSTSRRRRAVGVRYLVVAVGTLSLLSTSTAFAQTPVSTCGTLSVPGETYVLSADISTSTTGVHCIVIDGADVTLLGNGHAIIGPGGAAGFWAGISVVAGGARIDGVTVSGFSYGISIGASNATITGNDASQNYTVGIAVDSSAGTLIEGNTTTDNGVPGNGGRGIGVTRSSEITVHGNTA